MLRGSTVGERRPRTALPDAREEGSALEFRILGPLEVVDGARPIAIRAGNDRAVLALLLLHANELVSSDRLIDELWGETPPLTAAKILQSSVSRLRRELGNGRIETRGHRYVMHVGPDELDALRFERLVRERRVREALALWRGRPLSDLDTQPFAAAAGRRLDELRLDALERRIDEDIARGGEPTLVSELESLTGEFPTRERLHAQLMRALYADGRQADALEVYRSVRRRLADELGLEPGPELRELEGAILRQDPTLPRPRPATHGSGRRRRIRLLVVASCGTAAAAIAAYVLTRPDAHAVAVRAGSVAVIDPASNRVVAAIPVGRGSAPGQLAAGPSGLWVTSPAEGTVIRIDPFRLAVISTYGVGGPAEDVALDRGGAWVVTGNGNSLVRIDPRLGVTKEIPLRATPTGAFSVAVGGGAVWVGSATLLKVDERTGAVLGRSTGHCCVPRDVAYAFGSVWVAETTESISRVGAASLRLVTSQRLGELQLSLAAGYGSMWATGTTTTRGTQPVLVWRLDAATGLPTAASPLGSRGPSPYFMTTAIAAGDGGIWVAVSTERAVFRLSPTTGRVVARIPTGRPPVALAVGLGRVWVSVR